MKSKYVFSFFLLLSCSSKKTVEAPVSNILPSVTEKVTALPPKEDFYIFLLAGQSNMAGRGVIAAADTLASTRVLTLDKNNQWVYAKEPLHFYEPQRTGLDCGLSFGKELSKLLGNNIIIGVVPCAVGGSSVEQWLYDSTYRGVQLYSNLRTRSTLAQHDGIIKGILWHQGETNANAHNYPDYQQKLRQLFLNIREDLDQPDLPVYAGELASFLSRATNPFADSVNKDLHALSASMKNLYLINTADLSPKPDSIHFDAASQRLIGKRFAQLVFQHEQ
jgi:hypothetical protein